MSYEKFYWLNDLSRQFLSRGYIPEGTTPEDRIRHIAESAQKILGIPGFADRFEDYMSRGWFSLSSPIWANFGMNRGLPISCFGSYIKDETDHILDKSVEIGIMSKHGGGTSAYFGDIRPRGSEISTGGKTDGPVRFMQIYETTTKVISQGGVRRGSMAATMPVEHPDILEFLQIQANGNPIQDLSIGVTITDAWMREMIGDGTPGGGDKSKREIMAKIIKKRYETGYPYIMFVDTANDGAPEVYKDYGKKIVASNLCQEIFLSSSPTESFVCDLSSMNILHYDEWKNTDAVETLTFFLDAVMTEFINKASKIRHMEAPVRFAKNQRALGIGTLGWHSYLQSKMIAFESMEAKFLNSSIHRTIFKQSRDASAKLAKLYGQPDLLRYRPSERTLYHRIKSWLGFQTGYGRRNVTTTAIAPTTSSSFVLGQVSPSIEPLNSNYFVKGLDKGKFTYRNPYLGPVLEKHGKNDASTWKSILVRGGSVQHLEFLTQHEKDVFRTFSEISQKEVVIQAGARQKHLDQGQSLNLMIPGTTPAKETMALIQFAWESKVKSLYYQRASNPSQELARSIMTCSSCEG